MSNSNNYIQTITSVEDFEPIARDIVTNYCIDNNINESDIYPTIWNDIITELYLSLFKPCKNLLKVKSVNNKYYNQYDIEKVEYIYIIYKRLCNGHCQEVSLKGFCDMSGVDKVTLHDWSSGRLSMQNSNLYQKISEDNEESLFALMKDRRNNPMKYLPKLNKVHNWNMPGVSRQKEERRTLSANELPKLNSLNCMEIANNSQENETKTTEHNETQFDTI